MTPLIALTLTLGFFPRSPFGPPSVVEFDAELDALSRGPACDGRPQLENAHRDKLEAHCGKVRATVDAWRKGWVPKAEPFFRELVPRGLPPEVVYPFGGADLLNALFVFPDAKVITVMALEPGGDPRSLAAISPAALGRELSLVRRHFDFLMRLHFSQTVDLDELVKGRLAGVLIYDVAALGVLGYEPLGLRFFELGKTGGRLYFGPEDIARIDAEAKQLPPARRTKFLTNAFSNFELRFRRRPTAESPTPPEQVFRHFAVDLGDENLRKDPRMLLHLEQKGKVASLVKAASNLLWWTPFSKIRTYLIDHVVWMVSDSSGLATTDLDPAVFVQETWGRFDGAPFPSPDAREAAVVEMWAKHPERPLDFFFGYQSKGGFAHLMVTRRR